MTRQKFAFKLLFFLSVGLLLFSTLAFAAPTVTSISPTSGPSNGGTEVTVYGSGFVDGDYAYVYIGDGYVSDYYITYAADGSWL
ncbi:conserved hypothetical protein, partial [sediment metagenome]